MMQPKVPANRHLRLSLLTLALCATSSLTAHAAYVVIDDDLLPTAQVEARNQEPTRQREPTYQPQTKPQTTAQHYSVPFARYRSPLTQDGRATLDNLLPKMEGNYIRIVGRPDAMSYSQGRFAQIPTNRANNIRDYLIRQGIPADTITVTVDNTPNPQPDGIYPTDLYISRAKEKSQPSRADMSYLMAGAKPTPKNNDALSSNESLTTQLQNTQAPTAADKAARAGLVKWVIRLAQTGQINSVQALKVIEDLSGGETETNLPGLDPQTNPPALAIQPVQPSQPAPMFVAAVATARKQQWKLEVSKTLRDNIDAWATSQGWSPTEWLASNFYQVTSASTLEGDFPAILKQIADSTKLNICIYQRDKRIKVTDANVSCKKLGNP